MTQSVREAQHRAYGRSWSLGEGGADDILGPDEAEFIRSRDSFYLATVSETGWPYVQHRGGAPGFLHLTSPTSLAFADFRGNRQLLSTGNVAVNDRVALFLMDYPSRTRLKILGHARIESPEQHPKILAALSTSRDGKLVERIFRIDVVAFDWNCPQHITPRFTAEEVNTAAAPLRERIAELEAQLKKFSSA